MWIAPAVAAIALLISARRLGVNMSALGIGVDFLQIVSMFTAFGFQWPVELTSLFKVASTSTLNEQLMAPECSISSWGFEMKCVLASVDPLTLIAKGGRSGLQLGKLKVFAHRRVVVVFISDRICLVLFRSGSS